MRKAFTMIEIIMTIVIMGILAGGTYISLEKLYTKTRKSKAISELSFDSTLISNQISALLSHRVPSTVIGYDANTNNFESIYSMSKNYNVLEWIGTDFENYYAGKYSSFIDFSQSDRDANMTFSPNTTEVNSTALIFAGSFDDGSVVYNDFNNSFGWYGNTHTQIYEINTTTSIDENITFIKRPSVIYEKYYLLDSAYAIAKYDSNLSACVDPMYKGNNTLLLFYNYKPWEGETFCSDANVTILSNETKGFEVDFIDGNLQFNLTLQRTIRKSGNDINVTISKQKVVF
jgi:prepilin-type N-terminal cleavage/methylation domain-containing protein